MIKVNLSDTQLIGLLDDIYDNPYMILQTGSNV